MADVIENERKGSGAAKAVLVLTAVLWGLAGVCVKSITWSSLSIMAVRSFISLIMVLAVKRSFRVRFTRANVLGAAAMCATGILYMQAIKLTTAGTAIVLQYTAPIFVLLYSVIFKKKKMRVSEIIIALAVFGGCVLSFADDLDPTMFLGNVLGLASGLTFAVQIIVMNGEGDSVDSMVIGNGLSFLICLPFMFFDPSLTFTASNVVWVLVLSVFQYGLANVLFSYAIPKVDGVEGSLILMIEPVFNPIPVAFICGEMMGPLAIAGSIIVIVFIALYAALPKIRAMRAVSYKE